jgi:hypothetical protein
MNFYNYSLIILITTTLFIAFIVQVVMRDNITLKKYLEDISVDFEAFYQLFSKKLLKKSEYVGLQNPKILFLKKKQCLEVNLNQDVNICYGNFKETANCQICQQALNEVSRNIGFDLKNNVKKTYLHKDQMVIYKKYYCKGEDLYLAILFNI